MTPRSRRLALSAGCVVAAGLLLTVQAAPFAQDAASSTGSGQALPTARALVDRHMKAIGGTQAYAKVSSIHATGSLEIVGQAITGTVEIFSARPAKLLLRVDITNVGKAEDGFDGKVGWEIDPLAGPSVLSGRRLTELKDDAFFDGPLHGPEHVKTMTTVAKTEFDKRPAYQVKITYASGNEATEYFDVDSGLEMGSEASRQTSMGVLPVTSVVRDYKKFGDLLQATTLVQTGLGIQQVFHLTSFDYNAVPASAFDVPASVKPLIDKK
jgi:hypothetical protein